MMSKADKMLEELGFIKRHEEMYINGEKSYEKLVYTKTDDEVYVDIYFYLELREYTVSGEFESTYSTNVELHQALHEKLKELGWI